MNAKSTASHASMGARGVDSLSSGSRGPFLRTCVVNTIWIKTVLIAASLFMAVDGFAVEEQHKSQEPLSNLSLTQEAQVRDIKAMEMEIQSLKETVHDLNRPGASDHESAMDVPKLNIRGFADVQYDANEDDNAFSRGDVDLFITSKVSPKLKFLTEAIFEFENGNDQESEIDLERILLKYEHSDYFHLTMGRDHTSLGYWNHTFHHGKWLQTTTDRPVIFQFEDKGGILPVHSVGLAMSGHLYLDAGNLAYFSNVGNGRAKTLGRVQTLHDDNDGKMVSGMLSFEPSFTNGLGFGASALYDQIPENPAVGRIGDMDEYIYGGHVYYIDNNIEFIAEAQFIEHEGAVGDFHHFGAFIQAAYSFGKIKPYYRYDVQEADQNDSFFSWAPSVVRHTAGIRYDWYPFAAIKFEYRNSEVDKKTLNWGTIQISFAF